MLHTTIDKSSLRGKHELLGKGGFGTVYRVKMLKVTNSITQASCQFVFKLQEDTGTLEDVVVKVINTHAHNLMGGHLESIELMVDKYADIRLELNKLCSSSHKYIVHFIGMTMEPLSFVMEWAPLGSFRNILTDHRNARCSLCPESVLLSIQQVCSLCVCVSASVCCFCVCNVVCT